MKISALELPTVKHPSVKELDLYHHQALMLDNWNKEDSFLLITKTGTGKTIGAILPLLENKGRAICIYPTNELIKDQVQSISKIAQIIGLKPCIRTIKSSSEEISSADVEIIHIDGPTLEEWRKHYHFKSKKDALKLLLTADKERKIVLTNPDILFLILALRYRAEVFASLQAYETLIVDEFHLYQGVEFAHALFMIYMARQFDIFKRVVLLSATPSPEVEDYLQKVMKPFSIDITKKSTYIETGKRTATYEVEIEARLAGNDVIEKAISIIKELKSELIKLRQDNSTVEYVPAVIVFNSVVDAIRLEDKLVEEGFNREQLAIIRGLSSRDIRRITTDTLIALGTSAIEVGIDFKCDYLIFEAFEAASFMQRFGRLGRHRKGIAYILAAHNVVKGISEITSDLDRGEFEKLIYEWYKSLASRPWFVSTDGGFITIYALADNIVKSVSKDNNCDNAIEIQVRDKIDNILASYAEILDCFNVFKKIKKYFLKKTNGDKKHEWLDTYQNLITFRTSMPNEMVLDFSELQRRGSDDYNKAKYSVDISSLIKRAEGLRFNEKIYNPDTKENGILTIKGYGKYKRHWVMGSFNNDNYGIFQRTKEVPDMLFIQEGHKTPISHIMTFRDHIFILLPKSVKDNTDWRMPVFDYGKNVIAFDGAALLLYEIWRRENN